MMTQSPEATLLRSLFDAAVAAAQPALCLPPHLPSPPRGRTLVIGAGKAAAAMAQAVEAHWPATAPLSGLVITPYGHALPTTRIAVAEAAHPVPDAAGLQATAQMRGLLQGLSADDLVLCLISGGGSALMVAPLPGITLETKQAVNRALLASGATIDEMNCLRRHLSAVKGGRLAAACAPARLVTLAISDVPGDGLATIASGPTVGDPTTLAMAQAVLDRYAIPLPAAARAAMTESLKPGDPRLGQAMVIASPQLALQAAANAARAQGLPAHILSDALEAESRDMGRMLAAIARQVALRGQPFTAPCVILSGGESTVTLRGGAPGLGGRNVECLLAMGLALNGLPGVHALAADTDGTDGAAPVAGAVIGPDLIARAAAEGLALRAELDAHNAHTVFARLDAQVITGPTHTNVNDFRAILILESPKHDA